MRRRISGGVTRHIARRACARGVKHRGDGSAIAMHAAASAASWRDSAGAAATKWRHHFISVA